MELYIGGYAQGKLDYVLSRHPSCLVFEDLDCLKSAAGKTGVKVLNHFHLIVKKMLSEGLKNEEIESEIMQALSCVSDLAIICNEIGNGIVPLDKDERLYRELTGRLMVKLAQKADKVVRISCGIPQTLK